MARSCSALTLLALPLRCPFSHHPVSEMKNQDLVPASCQGPSGSPAMGRESLPALGPSSNPTCCPRHQSFTVGQEKFQRRVTEGSRWFTVDCLTAGRFLWLNRTRHFDSTGSPGHSSSALSSSCRKPGCLQRVQSLWRDSGKRCMVQNSFHCKVLSLLFCSPPTIQSNCKYKRSTKLPNSWKLQAHLAKGPVLPLEGKAGEAQPSWL